MSAGLRTIVGAGAAMIEAGVLRPVSPRLAVRLLRRRRALGVSPALLGALAAERWPTRTAIVDDLGSLTYAELDRQADALAVVLHRDHGLGPGEALAVMCRNHRGLVTGLLAAGRLHADLVLVNTELPPAQVAPTLERHAPRVLLHDADLSSAVAEFAGGTITAGSVGADLHSLVLENVPAPPSWPSPPPREPRLVILTSGTTGTPRGVPRAPSGRDLLGTAASLVHRLRMRRGEAIVLCPPAFHGLGLVTLLLGILTGSTIVLRHRFDASTAAGDVQRHDARLLVVVPVMLQRLLALPDVTERLGPVRSILSGGSALSPAVAAEAIERLGPVLLNGYGSSEIGVAAVATAADLAAAPGTVGRPVLGTSVQVVDDHGALVRGHGLGRIVVSSPLGADGYTEGGGKERLAGHLASGDVGWLDDRGRLHVTGRADDMIVSGGENVFPQPVEDALLRFPGVREATVLGVSDDDFGQRLAAFVVADDVVDPDDLRVALRAELARYEMPRSITQVDALPRTASGKVRRSDLVALEERAAVKGESS